ncbi:hypothetical protein SHJG_5351 [Streptomyces hygroscopicus subsp. jinggangensis 5008]|nr:hypothetical protein SHJG_5351 [Streptomyces hygroscopicus subsp. jinggangensis 5008]AGF64778.1 hypothetical protein SHJGH_5115 [Streptomyces hygroscopicus subsp. jinggangensis TL01]
MVGDEDRAASHGHVCGKGQLSVRRGAAVPEEAGRSVARHGARQAVSVRRIRRPPPRRGPGRHAATPRHERGRVLLPPATSHVHGLVSRISLSFRTTVGISSAYRSGGHRRSSHRVSHPHGGGAGRNGRRREGGGGRRRLRQDAR